MLSCNSWDISLTCATNCMFYHFIYWFIDSFCPSFLIDYPFSCIDRNTIIMSMYRSCILSSAVSWVPSIRFPCCLGSVIFLCRSRSIRLRCCLLLILFFLVPNFGTRTCSKKHHTFIILVMQVFACPYYGYKILVQSDFCNRTPQLRNTFL